MSSTPEYKPKGGKRKGAGRKRTRFDWTLLETLCQRKLTKEHCAEKLGVNIDTVLRRIKDKHGVDFTTYRQMKTANTCLQLIEKGLDLALKKGDSHMLRYMLDNFMDFSKKVDHTSSDGSMSPSKSTREIRLVSDDQLELLEGLLEDKTD
jgi:hypothetical protein